MCIEMSDLVLVAPLTFCGASSASVNIRLYRSFFSECKNVSYMQNSLSCNTDSYFIKSIFMQLQNVDVAVVTQC